MRSIILAVIGFSLAVPSFARPAPNTQIDSIFADMAKPDTPGCVVGVSNNGQVTRRAYGLAELEHRVPLTVDSILEAGSVSKQFTAAAILLLVEDGKLALTDDVRRYVPELPTYDDGAITIDHLLSHTSGLRDWGAVAQIGGWPRETRAHTQSDAVQIIRRQQSLNYAPGAEYSYTNSGYNLLTEIVQRVSGKSLAEFSRERMFVPLGMTSTSWRDDFRRIVRNRAVAYARTGDGFAQVMPFEDVYGNGGLLTTVGDLLRWNAALAAGRVGKSVTERLQQPATLKDGTTITYARGLFVERHDNSKVLAHSGATGGYRSWMARFPDQKLAVALLCNRGDAQATQLGWRVADLFLPAGRPAGTVPPYSGPERSGMFVNSRTGGTVTLSTSIAGLAINGETALPPVGPERFRDDRGAVLFLGPDTFRATDQQGQAVDYRRAASVSLTREQLSAYPGYFASDEADAAYNIEVDGNELIVRLDRRPHIAVRLKLTYADAFEGGGMIVRFERDAAGVVTAMTIGNPRVRRLRFIRKPDL